MKSLLTKARKRATVDIDGDKITIQELSLEDSQALRRDGDDEATVTLRTVIASVIGEDGVKVYTDSDIPALKSVGLRALRVLGLAIAELNSFKSPNV